MDRATTFPSCAICSMDHKEAGSSLTGVVSACSAGGLRKQGCRLRLARAIKHGRHIGLDGLEGAANLLCTDQICLRCNWIFCVSRISRPPSREGSHRKFPSPSAA